MTCRLCGSTEGTFGTHKAYWRCKCGAITWLPAPGPGVWELSRRRYRWGTGTYQDRENR